MVKTAYFAMFFIYINASFAANPLADSYNDAQAKAKAQAAKRIRRLENPSMDQIKAIIDEETKAANDAYKAEEKRFADEAKKKKFVPSKEEESEIKIATPKADSKSKITTSADSNVERTSEFKQKDQKRTTSTSGGEEVKADGASEISFGSSAAPAPTAAPAAPKK